MARIYISSTFEDLKEYREAVSDTLRKMQHEVVAMEDYAAADRRPLDKCLADVARSEIYMGIFGWRYGYVPNKDNPEGKSITELEHRAAVNGGKPRLIFLLDPKTRWDPQLMDPVTGEGEAGKRIRAFREELASERLASFFDSPDDLAAKVSVAVTNLQQEWIAADIERQRQQMAVERDRRSQGAGQRIVGQHVQDVSDHFKGRSEEARKLGQLLAEPSTRVVSVIGRAGIGKTALASKILTDLERNRWPHTDRELPVDGIVYLSTPTGISLATLFEDCSLMLGGEREEALRKVWASSRLDTASKVEQLLEALDQGLYVVLLDHMEDLLDSDRRIRDPELQIFFDRSLAAPHGARLLVTSRYPLDFSPEMMPYDQRVRIVQGLSVPEGIALLREMDPDGQSGLRDLPDDQLARAVERVHGIPRALQLLARIVRDEWQKSLDEILEGFYVQENVAEQLVQEAYARLDDGERRIMEALAVLGRPVPQVAVEFMVAPFTPGLNVAGVLRRLIPTYMVTADRASKTLSLNPIDQDYARSQLPEEAPYSRKALEQRAAEYYAQLRASREKWRSIIDIEPQLLEFRHRVRAGEYDEAVEVLSGLDVSFLVSHGHARKVQDMYRELGGKLKERRSQMLHAFGLGETGIFVGPFEQVIEWMKTAATIAHEIGDAEIELQAIGGMGEVKRRLGLMDAAIHDLEQAAAMYRPGCLGPPDGFLLSLSLAYSYRGKMKEAIDAGQRLMKLAADSQKMELQGRAHDALSLAYLVLGDCDQAAEHARQAVEIYEASGARDPRGYALNVQGIAQWIQGRRDEAMESFERGRTSGRQDDNPRLEAICLYNLARAHRVQGDLGKALEMAESAASIFKKVGAAELSAASLLAEGIRAHQRSDTPGEARALLACARATRSNPDLQPPLDLLTEAESIGRAEGMTDLAAEAADLLGHIKNQATPPS